jgi:GT2 family glycosyltransferase
VSAPKVEAVVLTYDGLKLVDGILASLAAQTYENLTITVVDNGSSDGTAEHLAERWPGVRVVRLAENAGVPAALNRGIAEGDAPLVALFNNDLELEPDWVQRLVGALETRPEAATATGKLLRHDDRGTIDAAGDGLLWSGAGLNRGALEPDRGQWDEPGWTFAACAGAALYRRGAFDRVGTFDERFFAYQEDVDWSLRAQLAGLGAWYEPAAVGYHMGGATTRKRRGYYGRLQRRNQLLVIAKCFPTRALLRHLPLIVAHQLLWLAASVRDGAGRDHLGAWAEAARMLPAMLRDRGPIQRARTADLARLDALVRASLPRDAGRLERLAFALAPEVMRGRRVARLRARDGR